MSWLVHPTITITVIVLLLAWWLGVLVTTVNSRRDARRAPAVVEQPALERTPAET